MTVDDGQLATSSDSILAGLAADGFGHDHVDSSSNSVSVGGRLSKKMDERENILEARKRQLFDEHRR